MPAIFTYEFVVPEEAIDRQGHVSNVEYIRWTLRAATRHSAAIGWSSEKYHEMGKGWVVRKHEIEYLQPAFAGDEIQVITWVANFRKIRSLRKYLIKRGDETLVRAQTDWTFFSLDHRVPVRPPEEVEQAFTVVREEDEPS